MILGISSLVSPIAYSLSFNKDIYVLLFGALFLFVAMFTGKKNKLDRWEALIFVLAYIGYVIYLIIRN
jgi:cation:H+ antiporter